MRRPTRILTIAAIVPLTAVALAACTPGTSLPTIATRSASPTPTPTATPGPTAAEIAALAKRDVGEGTVVSVEDESLGTEWDVRVVVADGSVQEMHVADDGAVLAGPSEDPTDANAQSANRAQVAATSITLPAAQQRMLAAVAGGVVTAIELGTYQDRVVWRGDVLVGGVRHDVRIDAVNGSVLLNQADSSSSATPPSGS
ncbi:MAG: hypothetical protein HIU86_08275 [Acidobacteria bacterium]|nr:hypothetical protein [Acidobacteriota bacterium]